MSTFLSSVSHEKWALSQAKTSGNNIKDVQFLWWKGLPCLFVTFYPSELRTRGAKRDVEKPQNVPTVTVISTQRPTLWPSDNDDLDHDRDEDNGGSDDNGDDDSDGEFWPKIIVWGNFEMSNEFFCSQAERGGWGGGGNKLDDKNAEGSSTKPQLHRCSHH